ncbi:gliding motility-associated lipoprotein GldJ/gliding motility-associated lipoprotein GldJ,TIGR03530 [Catalinimonas alkaloidigena]|uniref:Gliding motility-associated lipoprotein GldJ/gliding motility-associated lipoprotein GldJ,TIGR03530 n=2 Tax=Catalinimonas alkaloidigena TaxID=1075417 RepID=A0A1G9EU24_9BACT|nr:gliding motility-associated lipoprotein GldJ/gliding motility-associated lipoprotein GldJ,TIGR03530 [Catalinimonas alkaloidigena]
MHKLNRYMSKITRATQFGLSVAAAACLLSACSKQHPTATNPGGESTATGLAYNDDEGFQVEDYLEQPEGPNLILIEGGRTVLGSSEEDIIYSRDNLERTVTIPTFYMDQTEVANIHWLEYLFYVQRDSAEEVYTAALPDTTVWLSDLAYNDPYVDHYLRYPGFRYYPVVGVTWEQANDYCKWRTAVVNQKLAEDAGIEVPEGGGRIPLESGVVLPAYRLPSEAEWEYAAQALIGTQYGDENQTHKRIYPWDGHALRNPYGKQMGNFLANFKRGRGDYAGIAGKLNDGAMITDQIYAYPPNDFGLYNMAGNVNEWVYDVYRPLTFQQVSDFNPLRRDGYMDEADGYGKDDSYSLIDDHVRVYKGGSWKDVAYWLSPGTRRYLAEDSSTATIGFRCAMIRAGTNY